MVLHPNVVEKLVLQGVGSRAPFLGDVLEHLAEQINERILVFNLVEFFLESRLIFFVVGKVLKNFAVVRHSLRKCFELCLAWGSQDLENRKKLVALVCALEQRLEGDHFAQNAACGPNVDSGVVLRDTKI